MIWNKEKPISCSKCSGYEPTLQMHESIAVGFGEASLLKNGEVVWYEGEYDDEECVTVKQAEDMAKENSDNDWRIHLIAPTSERYYQRQGEGLWVLYKKGEGFA